MNAKYFNIIIKVITNKDSRFLYMAKLGFYNNMSDKEYLERKFKAKMGTSLDLENPKTFNEKLQWLKLYDRNPIYTKLVDKYEVKGYVANMIGEEHIIPTLGVWDDFDEIDFDKLPKQFVLKCTHDSGGLVIVKDKDNFDKKAARKKLVRSLKKNYFWSGREWPYKEVKPRIIVEKYMENSMEYLTDYKIYNFNGKPSIILVCMDRFSKAGMTEDFYDCSWNHLDVSRPNHKNSRVKMPKPREVDEMLGLAEKLSCEAPFLRTEFYIIDGKIYFGELTFYPASGFEKFIPIEWDYKMGKLLNLPDERRKD